MTRARLGRHRDHGATLDLRETGSELHCLRATGVDAAQGFVIHRSCPLAELIRQTSPDGGHPAADDAPPRYA